MTRSAARKLVAQFAHQSGVSMTHEQREALAAMLAREVLAATASALDSVGAVIQQQATALRTEAAR